MGVAGVGMSVSAAVITTTHLISLVSFSLPWLKQLVATLIYIGKSSHIVSSCLYCNFLKGQFLLWIISPLLYMETHSFLIQFPLLICISNIERQFLHYIVSYYPYNLHACPFPTSCYMMNSFFNYEQVEINLEVMNVRNLVISRMYVKPLFEVC